MTNSDDDLVERIARKLARAALAVVRQAEKADKSRLRAAVRRAEDNAGTMPARDAVKLRPSDWHAVCDLARKVTAPPEDAG